MIQATVEALPEYQDQGLCEEVVRVQVAFSTTSLSLLPERLRMTMRSRFCPLKGGEHDSAACVVEVDDFGQRTLRCLSRNHPDGQHSRSVEANILQHAKLASLLVRVWGAAAWLDVLLPRYKQVKYGSHDLVEFVQDELGDCAPPTFRTIHEVNETLHGFRVYHSPSESRSRNKRARSDDVPAQTHLWEVRDRPFELWCHSPRRTRYLDVVYDPALNAATPYLNMWSGFAVWRVPTQHPPSASTYWYRSVHGIQAILSTC